MAETTGTKLSSTIAIVEDNAVQIYIGETPTSVPLKQGMIGCFNILSSEFEDGEEIEDNPYNLSNTGILRRIKSEVYGAYIWACRIAGKEYLFNDNGDCTDGNNDHHLYILISSLEIAEGNVVIKGVTRGGEGEEEEDILVNVDSLNVRDSFAIAALQSLIARFDDPLECSTAAVKFITDKAYEYANAMMVSSVESRVQAGEGGGGQSGDSTGTVEVPADSLSSNTEKLLNNIHKAIEGLKTQEAANHTAGIKIATVTPTLKIDNPDNDEFDVNGGGGGEITRANMNLVTAVYDLIVFSQSSDNVPSYIRFTKFLELLRSDFEALADARITAKVKAEALNS